MKIVDLDYYSLRGESLLHKTSAGLKMFWVALLITLVVASNNVSIFAMVYAVMFVYIIFSKLPARVIIPLSFYPLIFAILFILSASSITLHYTLTIVLKVLIAATALILLFTTTSYKNLFIRLNKILPGFLSTSFFLTYRAIFILWTTLENIQKAIYLRGGVSLKHPRRSLQVIGNALGFLVIKSIDSSEKMYESMRLRGHSTVIRYLDESEWKR
jgi:cobalt/nickel transport system permease protein